MLQNVVNFFDMIKHQGKQVDNNKLEEMKINLKRTKLVLCIIH